jgi:putative flavoprotein involved in K+ transport
VSTHRTSVVVIGGGPAGLATSRCLARLGVDHVVLERGQIGQSWRSERWDSLRLLTPTWMNRLPGDDTPPDPDGYLTASEFLARLERSPRQFDAPILEHTTVTSVRSSPSGFTVDTDQGRWSCRATVLATGAHGQPVLPAIAAALPARLHQLHSLRYRNPDQIAPGGVLVVGGSSSGVQIADELRRAGRDVTIAVGDHVRLPRTYRGRDIYWWMHAIGLLDERFDAVPDLARARRLPSAQLIGTPQRRSLDLATLRAAGVRICGRLVGVTSRAAQFAGSLANHVASADLKLARLLDRIDRHSDEHAVPDLGPIDRPQPVLLPVASNEIALDQFETVVWASGMRPDDAVLDPGLLDRRGMLSHQGGIASVPGLYVIGRPVLRRRSSGLIAGIGSDAVELTDHLRCRLDRASDAA